MIGSVLHGLYTSDTIRGVFAWRYVERFMHFLETDNTLNCVFSDRLDGYACPEIERELSLRVANFKKGRQDAQLVFDLTDVIYISSAFLRICLIYCKTFGKHHFSVANVSEDIHKVFHISGFIEIMHVTRADRTPKIV